MGLRGRLGIYGTCEEYTKNEIRRRWCSRIYYKIWALYGGIMARIPWCDAFTVFSRRFEKRRTSKDFHSSALKLYEDHAKKIQSWGGVGKDGLIRVLAFMFISSAAAFSRCPSPPGEINLLQLAFFYRDVVQRRLGGMCVYESCETTPWFQGGMARRELNLGA